MVTLIKWRKYFLLFLVVYITACTYMLYASVYGGTKGYLTRKISGFQNALFTSGPIMTPRSDQHKQETMTSSHKCDCSRQFPPPSPTPLRTPTELCPEVPRSLVGPMNVSSDVTVDQVQSSEHLRHVQPGGSYTPHDCIAREAVAIIIPYRSRPRHLSVLIHHLHTVLQRQELSYTIYVIELAYPSQFNRGLLANVGFLTAFGARNYTCYVIHDVDLLPADDRNLYRCGRSPRHLSVSSSKFGYRLPYEHYFGGVIALTPEQYIRVNGFSNLYFGWGKEDDDLYKRITEVHYMLERPDPYLAVYREMPHPKDATNPDNPMKDGLLTYWQRRWRTDGVSNVLYSRVAMEFRPLYTWVLVNTSEATLMKQLNRFIPARVKLPKQQD